MDISKAPGHKIALLGVLLIAAAFYLPSLVVELAKPPGPGANGASQTFAPLLAMLVPLMENLVEWREQFVLGVLSLSVAGMAAGEDHFIARGCLTILLLPFSVPLAILDEFTSEAPKPKHKGA